MRADRLNGAQFVLKTSYGPRIVSSFFASYPEIYRDVKRRGPFVMTEGTGKYLRDVVRLGSADMTASRHIRLDAKSVKSAIRRLRDQERDELLEIERQRRALDDRENAVIRKAWERGNVVQVAEVKAKVAEAQKRRQDAKAAK